MAKVLFKKGPSQSFDTDKDLNSIIFKKSTNPQAPGFSEIYLGDNRCGVGHNFSIGSDGLVPAPTMADIGKVLTPNGWIDLSKISGSDNVKQVGIESSTTLYPILLKGTTGASDYTGQVNFTSTVNQNTPLLSASPDGHLICKSLDAIEGNIGCVLGDINLMDMPVMSGGHSLNLVSSVNSSTESSPSILLARSTSLGTTTDQYTNWRIQNAANGVLTFTPEKTGGSESPFVSVLSNVTATSFTVSGASSADTYIKADGSGYGGAFTGAGEAAGTAGLVPAPAIGDAGKYLKGDGTWGEIQGGTQSDWEEDDSTDLSYVQNRPAVRAGTGNNAVVEGNIANNEASGQYSHAEGTNTLSFGEDSHAEGIGTVAYEARSHAEGFGQDPYHYPDAPFKLTGSANAQFYTVDITEGIYKGMVLYYNGVYASVVSFVPNMTPPRVILTNTLDSDNALSDATVKMVMGTASGLQSHSEGVNTRAYGNASHAEGNYTLAINGYEHAQGNYNKSNQATSTFGNAGNTLNSIGIGTSESDRKNAIEVMQNGDVYVYGVGDYDGTNPGVADTLQDAINNASMDLAIPVTYSELVTLKTGGNLVPGMQYRITDYTSTTTQANTQSAGHVFDIIVTADSETELNEKARAAHHTGDTYFTNCNLDAWELKYCLENDTNRFVWADSEGAFYDNGLCPYVESHNVEIDNIMYYAFSYPGAPDGYVYSTERMPASGDTLYVLEDGQMTIDDGFGGDYNEGGKGVIYYMKDEWNNIAPFDFKNILFTRDTTWFNNHQSWATSVLGSVPSTNMNFYFLSWITQNNEVQDLSIVGQTLTNNGGKYVGVFNNEIKGTSAYDMSITENATTTAFALPCTIIVNNYSYGSGNFYGCYGNSFGNSCYNNSFGNKCYCVTFGNKCYGNTFGNDCYGNSFGNSCYNNSFGNTCTNNIFRNNCFNNSFGGACFQNSFGVGCYSNTFGDNFLLSSFGDYCYENTFGSNIQSLTAFEHVHWCNVTGGTNTPIKNTQILNGTHGTSSSSKLTITFTANKVYTQVAGQLQGNALRIWIAEDTVTGPSSAVNDRIAVFNGNTGKVIKDSGVYISNLLTIDDLVTPVTYSDLVDLKTDEVLVPGMQYRITDYTCTTTQADTQSAGHVFDIIVTADSEMELNENARATHHDGDTYFTNCDLDSWELKYCLENDTNRFAWADTTNGKGVIYYMKDEWNNECPYDFKNIMFLRGQLWRQEHQELEREIFGDCEEEYFYTFSCYDTENLQLGDASLKNCDGIIYDTEECSCFCNTIKIRKGQSGAYEDSGNLPAYLNNIVFFNTYETDSYFSCFFNVFETDCFDNIFGNNCHVNSFGDGCQNNSFGNGCHQNSFGNNCRNNTLWSSCSRNTFGDGCYQNSFGDGCQNNSFGNNCGTNSFGDGCYTNSFGGGCHQNTFGDGCQNNSFGNNCGTNSFGNYCQYITIFDGVQYCNITGGTSSAPVKNAQILNGTKGTSSSNKLTITFTANKNYTQVAGLVNGTTLRIWIAEDTVTGPTTATDSHIALFDGTTGKIIKDSGVTVGDLQVDVPEYTIEKLGTAETGYISSYVLKKDGVQAGSTINIPKDYLVKSGSVVEVVLYNGHYYESTDTGHTTQLDGYGVNSEGKYLKFVINTVDGTGNTSSIYISVQDLVDAYQAGNGISIDASNYISVKIDSANANGLATTTAGLKLDTVTTTTNGAMTATDKVKLDSINGNYWGSQTLSAAASYATTPEFQNVTINGDSTATQASTDHCVMVYDTTNKCLKFTF